MKRIKVGLIVLGVFLSALPATTLAAPAAPYTCNGGAIPADTYRSLTIVGNCSIPSGTVTVLHDLTLEPSADLNAGFSAATVNVQGNVIVGSGAVLFLGCSVSLPCAAATSDTVDGNIVASQPLAMVIHGNTIGGNVAVQGGGDWSFDNAVESAYLSAIFGIPVPPVPTYSAYENNSIGGNLSVSGYSAFWIGFHRNVVGRNIILETNNMAPYDPDLIEVADNTVHRNLICNGNLQGVSDEADGAYVPNAVSGLKLGQCKPL